jgi:hypothetical protein
VAGCGGDDKPEAPAQGTDSGTGAGRVETRDIVLETARRPARHKITLDGNRFAARPQLLLPIELKLTNRRKGKLEVGAISAELTDGQGKRYLPIYADGRKVQAPVFADRAIAAGEAAHSLILYRVSRAALEKSRLTVRDPARGAKYKLRVF